MKNLLSVITLLSACGSSGGGSGALAPSTSVVTTADDLPACSSRNKNQLVYISDSRVFVACAGNKWDEILYPVGAVVVDADGKLVGPTDLDGPSLAEEVNQVKIYSQSRMISLSTLTGESAIGCSHMESDCSDDCLAYNDFMVLVDPDGNLFSASKKISGIAAYRWSPDTETCKAWGGADTKDFYSTDRYTPSFSYPARAPLSVELRP